MASRTLSFVATECGSVTRHGTLLCGASNSKSDEENHSLIFIEDDEEPPYFELDDQSQGHYGAVKRIAVSDELLAITLVGGKKNLTPYSAINVDLRNCAPKQVVALKRGLPKVFRGYEEVLAPAAKPRARKSSRARRR